MSARIRLAERRARRDAEIAYDSARADAVSDTRARPAASEPLAALLDGVVATVRRYMALSCAQADASALWVAHTYAFDAADFTPYLHVYSPERECGKSTLLDVLEALACRGWKADGASPAYLFRKIENERPALLLDELDTVFAGALAKSEGAEGIRGVLNSGFKRGGRVGRCVGDSHETREFSTFSPKVVAGIGALPDTIASRCIPIRLERATATDVRQLARLRGDRVTAEVAPITDGLQAWASSAMDALRDVDPDVPDALGARAADIWRPLLAIADAAGLGWGDRARRAAVTLHRSTAAMDELSPGALLLADLADIFAVRAAQVGGMPAHLGSADLVRDLAGREDRPWPEFRGGLPLTVTQLARLLRPYGIRTHKVRDGTTTPWVYRWADMAPIIARYVPGAPLASVQPGTAGTPEQSSAGARSAVSSRSGVPGVPGSTGVGTKAASVAAGVV